MFSVNFNNIIQDCTCNSFEIRCLERRFPVSFNARAAKKKIRNRLSERHKPLGLNKKASALSERVYAAFEINETPAKTYITLSPLSFSFKTRHTYFFSLSSPGTHTYTHTHTVIKSSRASLYTWGRARAILCNVSPALSLSLSLSLFLQRATTHLHVFFHPKRLLLF